VGSRRSVPVSLRTLNIEEHRHRGCPPPLTAFSVADTNAVTNTDKVTAF
jgi:hypothetical protein